MMSWRKPKEDPYAKTRKWDKRFYEMAKTVASWSKDPICQVGAVVVAPDKKQFSMGYNGLPSKMADDPEILENVEAKNRHTIHAEMNCILNSPQRLEGWTLYVTKYPCKDCALAIVQSGITRVVAPAIKQQSKWVKNCTNAKKVFGSCGIIVSIMEDDDGTGS